MRSLWHPERRSISYQDVWGSGGDWAAVSSVTAKSALGLDAVWACVNMHAGMASALPIDAFRGPSSVAVSPAPTVIERPSLALPFDDWLFQYYVSLLLFGNVYGVVLGRDRLGYPTTVEWQNPADVEVDRQGHRAAYRVAGQTFAAEDVWHDRWFTMPGSLVGLAPLTMHRETVGLGLAAQRFGAQWFRDGAHPSAVLSTEQQVTQEQATTIKERFVAAVRNTREPAVLGAGVTYQQIQVAPNESQFLETQQHAAVAVARVFGIQPEMVSAAVSGSSVTYANVEQQAIQYLTFGLDRWLVKGERAITRHLPRGMFAKFNRGALLRTDLLSRYQAHAIALKGHFLNIDEVRELEDRPPLENGEEFPPRRQRGKRHD